MYKRQVGIHNLHPQLVRLVGKLKFRTSYGQNVLKHSIEVAKIAGMLAQELGLDDKDAKRGGLLHDLGKAIDHEVEGTHISVSYTHLELMKIYNNAKEIIGNTPLLKLNSLKKEGRADIYVKVEKNNIAGSIKDRIALYMIEEAEKNGKLKKGDTIVEPTSGNTGVALAALAAAKGYKCILTLSLIHILNTQKNLVYSVSVTTRKQRPGEIEGVSYFFKSHEEFEKMIEEDKFLEYAKVHDNYYEMCIRDSFFAYLDKDSIFLF